MAHLLGAERLTLEYPTRIVLEDITIGIDEGDRIGIVGRNGDGKSSLMGMLAGSIEPNSGRVTRRSGVSIGVLAQRDDFGDHRTLAQAIVGDTPEYEWASDGRIRDVIAGLVSDLDWNAELDSLSGGQRRRASLAALLVGDWDVLMLDEPTNHLDVEGVAWLADHLKRRWTPGNGAFIVVTHDRWFLDEVCLDTWEVHDRTVEEFEGGYAAYVLQRVERDRMAATSEAKRQNLMKKELAWLRRGAPARTAKPKFRIEAATQLIEDVPPVRDPIGLARLATARLGKDVVDLENASFSYGGPTGENTLTDIEWRIAPGERTGILGANGVGKSTLLGLITGVLEPTSGRVKRGTTVRISTLTQQLDDLDAVAGERVSTVVGRLRTEYTTGTGSNAVQMSPGQLLERLGFTTAQLSTAIKDLSGGQRRRLQLLLILLEEPNVLILDEPTNDLDTDMLAAMEDLLDTWPGTLLVVSHDRYLMERVTDQQYAVMDGKLRHLPRGVDQYLELRKAQDGAGSAPSVGEPGHARSDKPTQTGAERRAAEKEVGSIERKLVKLRSDRVGLLDRFATHDQSDFAGLGAMQASLAELDERESTLEDRWLELTSDLED
ncbi:ABC-F family ATP-binding cassette domain-containing protein [Naasia lichenicola]|uniref:ABC-F family ATP-binding cassette domain-containing protein n=1 Tax=Naasia lichenicola TaxID=2565933 RepID=A0A4S4FFI9_9MICO|nr:ABC-F family ATP-binding cassette domain-containing protein [Naasia lichenicola]THG28394.1 ABC-F family ATP-binding cassette domain-containing protein [Naasia lichenicola]